MTAAIDLRTACRFVAADAAAGRLARWGWSSVIDEIVHEAVIEADVFDHLAAAAGREDHFPIGNAGVLHVYGYWFSEVVTPFGKKRDRWADGLLARALDQDSDAFQLREIAGTTPLQRVTTAALPVLAAPQAGVLGSADASVDGVDTRVVLVSNGGQTALVYGVDAGAGWQLITAFPFAGDADALLSDFATRPALRWNAVAAPTAAR